MKSEIKRQARRHFFPGLCSWLLSGCRLALYSCDLVTWAGSGEGEKEKALVSSFKGTSYILRLLPSWPCVTLITSQKPRLQILSHWELFSKQVLEETLSCFPDGFSILSESNDLLSTANQPLTCFVFLTFPWPLKLDNTKNHRGRRSVNMCWINKLCHIRQSAFNNILGMPL